ncbi:hypothetical protein Are01nite_26650 [Actinoplanes regularis]|nr:hypothetical protein Are01nite_26650 [Actinoplanes regularis]
MRGALLGDHVEGVEAGVPLAHRERDGGLSRREPAEVRHPELDDEVTAGGEVAGRVPGAFPIPPVRAR